MIIFDKYLCNKGNIDFVDEYTLIKKAIVENEQKLNDIKKVVEWSASKDNDIAVPAFNFQKLKHGIGSYHYSYNMLRLGKLSGEQRFAIKFISDLFYEFHKDPFNPDSLDEELAKRIEFYWDKHNDLMHFLMRVIKSNKYNDLHEGNVMIHPETEAFCLCDLEGFIHGKYNLEWLNGSL